MALEMVHLLAAKRYAERFFPALVDSPEYYLGAISPDAVHIPDGSDKSRKRQTHFGCWRGERPSAILHLWQRDTSAFAIGYGVHILTDVVWVRWFTAEYPMYLDACKRVIPARYYADADPIDRRLHAENAEIQALLPVLAKAVPPEKMGFLTSAHFIAWRAAVLNQYANPSLFSATPVYMSTADTLAFINSVPDRIAKLLKEDISMKNDVLKAIAARYSCRAYTDQPISVEAANALIDAALHAPSARNGQPWHFSVVQNTEDLRAFDDAMRDILRTREPEKYADDSYSVTYRAPMVIFITAPDAPGNVFTKIDCGIAVQNIALAAQSMGLGSVILGMPREVFTSQRAAEFKKKFAVPDGYEFQIAIAVGHANATKEPHIPEEDKYSLIL